MVGTQREVEALAQFRGRCAGTDAERRAAGHLRNQLTDMGREADLQSIRVWPRFGVAHALHALLAVVGSVVAVSTPAPGSALVLLAALLTFLDAAGYLRVVRAMLGGRASQNVESREHTDKPGVLVVAAGYDSPRESGALGLSTRLLRDPWLAMTAFMLVILVCGAVRLAGIDSIVVTAVQFVPTVLLILIIPALIDVHLSGAGEDRAGAGAVVTTLRLAEDLGGQLEHFDLWVVLTGANQPFALGMAAWLRQRRKELDRQRTAVVSIGAAGSGPVRYTRREGPIFSQRSHRNLVRLSREVAEDAAGQDASEVRAYVSREPSNAARAISRGLPSITLSTAGREAADDDALDRLHAFAREVIERLDAEVGPSLRSGE